MSYRYNVKVNDFSNLQEIEGSWKPDGYAALLDAMEFGDSSELGDDELREMCLMSLQDQEPEEAAYLVLKQVIGDDLREGQLRNMANESRDEKLWEEYVEPSFHGRLFTVGSLLYAALPAIFPKTDAVCVKLEVTASDAGAKELLLPTPNLSFLVRLLADGMDDHAVLHRLYGEQLTGKSFPNAAEIIWDVRTEVTSDAVFLVEVVSSGYWLDALEQTATYESTAYADEIVAH